MNVNFHNVLITIEAATPELAYARLCDILSKNDGDLEYTTDSFTTEEEPNNDRNTSELWQKEPEEISDREAEAAAEDAKAREEDSPCSA